MQILVAVIILVLFAMLRPRLSMDHPASCQHLFEVIYTFLRARLTTTSGTTARAFFRSSHALHLYSVLQCDRYYSGVRVADHESSVPAGCALLVFIYYKFHGFKAAGIAKYLAHFARSHADSRATHDSDRADQPHGAALSLTIRLFANMLAAKSDVVFLGLTYLIAPAVFMGLHVFVHSCKLIFRAPDHDVSFGKPCPRATLIHGFMQLPV